MREKETRELSGVLNCAGRCRLCLSSPRPDACGSVVRGDELEGSRNEPLPQNAESTWNKTGVTGSGQTAARPGVQQRTGRAKGEPDWPGRSRGSKSPGSRPSWPGGQAGDKFQGRGLLLDDLVGEGNLGLIHAAEVYDPAYQTRFSTYASYWIEEAIRDALINRTAMIRLPAYMVSLLSKWDRARRSLNHEANHTPTFEEVARHLNLTKREQKLIQMAQRTLRRQPERGIENQDGQSSGGEPIDNRPGPADRAQTDEELKELEARMHRLDEREQKVIECRFGLGGQSPRTLREIGENMGCTREWISRLERRAIDKLGCLRDLDGPPSPRPRISV